MKKMLLLVVCSGILFGCKKRKEDDPFVLHFQKLLDRYMICDSIQSKFIGTSTTQIIGKGNGQDLQFHSNNTTFTKYTSPEETLSFSLRSPDKMFYFLDELQEDHYYLVPSVTDNTVVLQKADSTGRIYTWYYRAE